MFEAIKHVFIPFAEVDPVDDIWDNDRRNSNCIEDQALHPQSWFELLCLEIDEASVDILLVANLFARSDKERKTSQEREKDGPEVVHGKRSPNIDENVNRKS